MHDGDIMPMLAALDLFPLGFDLPITHRLEPRSWRTSQIVPMGGRTVFEVLSCPMLSDNHIEVQPESQTGLFVRIIVNDGIVALPGCESGPGSSCPLAEFLAHVERRGEEAGDFRKMCGLGEEVAARITFLHQ